MIQLVSLAHLENAKQDSFQRPGGYRAPSSSAACVYSRPLIQAQNDEPRISQNSATCLLPGGCDLASAC